MTGIAFVVLSVAGFLVVGEPKDASHSPEEIVDWYTSNTNSIQAGAFIVAFAAVMLVFFAGYLRKILHAAEGENGALSLISFAGAVVIAVGAALDTTILLATAERVDDISPESVQTLQALGDNDYIPIAAGTLIFVWATGVSILRHGALNRWFGWALIVLGVLALTPLGLIAFLGTGLWILVLSVMLLLRGDPTAP
ncbi:MAG TPA: hypothetical protein VEX15_08170 [Nocardioidaceae bacterium]|nr:hypothetical protein [Nocardioidaceae bacterium]